MSTHSSEAYTEHTPPQQGLAGFHCPNCGVYSRQVWFDSATLHQTPSQKGYSHAEVRMQFGRCDRCEDLTVWRDGKMVFPASSAAPRPHRDMPAEILPDYNEARGVVANSPRAAAALLRLATEKLTIRLLDSGGATLGKDLNDNIGMLVKNGLPASIQMALDSLRVIGNEAVHPGMLDLRDDTETALRLFKLLNIIVENRITEPKEIESLYSGMVPSIKKEQIEKRDAP